jgi:LuxR family transcriptional regulator, maltose regulon positive regulatory protein
VAGYLVDEVLSCFPDAKREFLSAISGCEEVTASLAAAVSGRTDAGEMLCRLERETTLVVSTGTGRRWYRVHALLRSHLYTELQRQAPNRAATSHGNAADWLAAHHRPAHAIAHACLAGDCERVDALLRRNALPLILSGEHVVLRRALAVLGDESTVGEPWPALISALLHLESGEPAAASADLAHAEALPPAGETPELKSLRQFVRSCLAQFAEMARITESPGSTAGNVPAVDALAKLHQGTALLAAANRARARELLQAALAVARDNGYEYLSAQCLTLLGRIAAAEGDFRLMSDLATSVDARIAGGLPARTAGMWARLLLAYGAFLRAEPAECLRQTARAAGLFDTGVPMPSQSLSLLMRTLRGAAQFDTGDRAAGLRQMREARLNAVGGHFAPDDVALAVVLEHRAATLLGWGGVASAVVRWAKELIPASGEVLLIRARGQLALHRHGSARTVLKPLLDGSVRPALPWSTVEAWLLKTEIALALRTAQASQARRALRTALSLAAPMEALYPVVYAAPEVMALLARQVGKLGAVDEFASRVLVVRSSIDTTSAPVSLTDRERGVLCLLPTQRSFAEIAQDLTVSPNTVKTHVRAIYTKLGVGTRRDALAVAVDQDFSKQRGGSPVREPPTSACPGVGNQWRYAHGFGELLSSGRGQTARDGDLPGCTQWCPTHQDRDTAGAGQLRPARAVAAPA